MYWDCPGLLYGGCTGLYRKCPGQYWECLGGGYIAVLVEGINWHVYVWAICPMIVQSFTRQYLIAMDHARPGHVA